MFILKGLYVQNRPFYREVGCLVQWSLASPLALESKLEANQGSVVANHIRKCRCEKAGHLQERVAVGTGQAIDLCLNKKPLQVEVD